MKNFLFTTLICFFTLLLINPLTAQQSLKELSIPINYTITSADIVLSEKQRLVNRPKIRTYSSDPISELSFIWYNIEFETTQKLKIFKDFNYRRSISLKFYFQESFLGEIKLPDSHLSLFPVIYAPGKPKYYYALNLIDVPINLLEEADRIEILDLK